MPTSTEQVVELVNAGTEPFPGEADLGASCSRGRRRRAAARDHRHAAAVAEADAVVVVVPLFVDDETGEPDFGWMDARPGRIAEHLTPGHPGQLRDHPAGRHHPQPLEADARGGLRPDRRARTSTWSSRPERVLTGRVFADLRRYPKLVGGIERGAARKACAFYEAVLDFDERPDLDRPNGVWDLGSRRGLRAGQARRDHLPRRQHRPGEPVRPLRRARSASTSTRSSRRPTRQPYSHIHRPGIAVGGHCIPVYPRLYLWNDPEATVVRAAREANAGMPEYAVGLLEGAYGDLTGARVVGARRRLPRRGEGDGVLRRLPDRRGAERARRRRVSCTTRCTPTRSWRELGFAAATTGRAGRRRDHPGRPRRVPRPGPADLPGVSVLVDGRRVTDPARFDGVLHRVIGLAR